MKLIFLLSLFLSTLFAFSAEVSSKSVINGKTIYIEFKKENILKYDKIVLGEKTYKIFENPIDNTKMYALVPIDYYAKPNHKEIKVVYKQRGVESSKSIFIDVKDGEYEKETLRVNPSKVNPKGKKVKKRIAREYEEAMKIYNSISDKSYVSSKFIMPLDSNVTSSFGTARIYNGSLKGYHTGTDFHAKIGTPIIASNDGIVVLVKKRFYSGGTVILDHGEGIYTCYFHMSKFKVKEGQVVKKAQVLGFSGKSGRVTGPHLHFAARVDGVQVDPVQLISLLNENLFKETK
jgi:murein DD-endopeptidase MepM/ murein hydrolase activator NlpD